MKRNENSSNDFPAAYTMGAQPPGKESDREESHGGDFPIRGRKYGSGNNRRGIIVISIAAIVPHNTMADSLMEEISLFVEENTEAEIIDEVREIR